MAAENDCFGLKASSAGDSDISTIEKGADSMNPIRRKMASFLTEAVHKEIEVLNPESPYAKILHEIGDVDAIITDEIDKICNTANLGEITEAFLLVRRLKASSVQDKEAVKNDLNNMAEKLIRRVETKLGPLRLSEVCRYLFPEL